MNTSFFVFMACLITCCLLAKNGNCQQWVEYYDEEKVFHVNVPANWKKERDPANNITTFKLLAPNSSDVLATVIIRMSAIDDTMGIVVRAKEKIKNALTEKFHVQENKIEQRNYLKFPGLYSDVVYANQKNGKSMIHFVSWTLFNEETQYTIQYIADPKYDNTFLETGLKIIHSSKLIDKDEELFNSLIGLWQGIATYDSGSAKDSIDLEITGTKSNPLLIGYSHRNGSISIDTITGRTEDGAFAISFFTKLKKDTSQQCFGRLLLRTKGSSQIRGTWETTSDGCYSVTYTAFRSNTAYKTRLLNTASLVNQQPQSLPATKKPAEGYELLFQGIATKLNAAEKQHIYKRLNFAAAKEDKKFTDAGDTDKEYPFEALVRVLDLNGDGTEEVVVNWGNTFTSGRAGSSVTLFIKSAGGYQPNLGFGGDIGDLLLTKSQGFPDLAISAPGMEIPIWRFNGYEYRFYKSVSANEYDKLKKVTVGAFIKNPGLLHTTAARKTEVGSSDKVQTSAGTKKPNPSTRKIITTRWKTHDIIGRGHDAFMRMKERNEFGELEFGKDGKLYMYRNGLLQEAVEYLIAPDGNSILVRSGREKDNGTIEVLSIKQDELIIKFQKVSGDDKIVLKPSAIK